MFSPGADIIRKIDFKKLMFFHLCYHVKAAYLASRFSEARKILKHLNEHYDASWLSVESNMPPIVRNLKFPDLVIRTMQKLKNVAN